MHLKDKHNLLKSKEIAYVAAYGNRCQAGFAGGLAYNDHIDHVVDDLQQRGKE